MGAAALMAAASIAVPGVAGATSASTKKPKPDFAYFAGKTITMIEPAPPSALENVNGVEVAQFLSTYLHATVNVQYVSINGIVGGTNEAASAPPNGLTIGITALQSILVAFLTGPDTFTFSLKKAEWLGSTGTSPAVFVSCNRAITSWSQVAKSTRPLSILDPPASSQLIRSELASKVFHFPATTLTGYSSATAALVGCERGDGDLAEVAFSQILDAAGTAITPGITPLLSLGGVPKISTAHSMFAGIPSFDTYVAKHPLKTKAEKQAAAALEALSSQTQPSLPYFVAPGTPAPYVLALSAAMQAAFRNPTIKQAMANVPDPNVLFPSSATTAWVNASLKTYGPEIQKVAASF